MCLLHGAYRLLHSITLHAGAECAFYAACMHRHKQNCSTVWQLLISRQITNVEGKSCLQVDDFCKNIRYCDCRLPTGLSTDQRHRACVTVGSGSMKSCPEPQPLQPKAITPAASARNRLKGMRRRAAKMVTCMQQRQQQYQPAAAPPLSTAQDAELSELTQLVQTMQSCSEQANAEGNTVGSPPFWQ